MKKLKLIKQALKRLTFLALLLITGAALGYSYHHNIRITCQIQGGTR